MNHGRRLTQNLSRVLKQMFPRGNETRVRRRYFSKAPWQVGTSLTNEYRASATAILTTYCVDKKRHNEYRSPSKFWTDVRNLFKAVKIDGSPWKWEDGGGVNREKEEGEGRSKG